MILEQITSIILTGIVSGGVVVVALKTEVSWIKKRLQEIYDNHEERLIYLERKTK